jgi:hypothetical protein
VLLGEQRFKKTKQKRLGGGGGILRGNILGWEFFS